MVYVTGSYSIKTYLLHFQHKSGRVSFEVVIHTNSGENLVSNAERGIRCRYVRALGNKTGVLLARAHKQGMETDWLTADLSEP